MPTLETYRKKAKQLVRWHREKNYSVGEKVRKLERFRSLPDRDVLKMRFPLTLAQEIVAIEAGHKDWTELKAATAGASKTQRRPSGPPVVKEVVPILLVSDVTKSAKFFREKLGFTVDFLHGLPPFYGSVARDGVKMHLRFVHDPTFAENARREESLICASFEVSNAQGLFEEFKRRGVKFSQRLRKQAWGGTDFHVPDPDGNVISFVTYSG